MFDYSRKKWLAIGGGLVFVILIWMAFAAVLKQREEPEEVPGPYFPPSDSLLGRYDQAAISCDSPRCSTIGRGVLEKGGKVADAAIATMLCMGVIHAQSLGLGGGFLGVYYKRSERRSYVLNGREKAPDAAYPEMFHGNPELSTNSPLAVAVPGELKGYWELYKRFGGGVPWKELLEPTIHICQDGFLVDEHTAKALRVRRAFILNNTAMAQVFANPSTEDVYQVNDVIRRPKLAETLRRIANSEEGGDLLYQRDSEIAQWLVEDLAEMGGIITMDDLVNYRVDFEQEPIQVRVHGDLTLHSVPPPGSGALMAFVLRVLSAYDFTPPTQRNATSAVQTHHYILEAFKHAYAKRTLLGDAEGDPEIAHVVKDVVRDLTDSDRYLEGIWRKMRSSWTSNKLAYYGAEFYQRDDHGTSHISVVGPDGDAISVTSTVNLYFGAALRSRRTGIIYNCQMDDFSAPNITNHYLVPPSPNNFIKPGKRPFSSATPAIFTDRLGHVRLVVGTAGGTKITTTNTYVSIRNLWFNDTIKEAIDAPRIHHQLTPMKADVQRGFPKEWSKELKTFRHRMGLMYNTSSVTMGIARSSNGSLWANCDFRKPCSIDGF